MNIADRIQYLRKQKGYSQEELASNTNKKTMKNLYLGFILIFATIAGIWSFTANRFNYDECFFIILAGGVVGVGIALILQVMSSLFGDKSEKKRK